MIVERQNVKYGSGCRAMDGVGGEWLDVSHQSGDRWI